jgi:hypothetical protein
MQVNALLIARKTRVTEEYSTVQVYGFFGFANAPEHQR